MSATVAPPHKALRVSTRLLAIGAVLAVLCLIGVANEYLGSQRASLGRSIALDTSTAMEQSGATSAAWYCAGPLPVGSQPEYSAISVANVSSRYLSAELLVVRDGGGVTRQALNVAAHSQAVLRLSSVGPRTFAAATVLANGAGIGVTEIIQRSTGPIVTPCVNHDAPNAYVPAGSTKGSSDVDVSIYDPSSTPAVANVVFATSAGLVSPPAYQGIPLGNGQVVVLNVGHFVLQRAVIATMVSSIGGHIVVGALDTMGVAQGVEASLLTATPSPEATWLFGGAPAGSSTRQAFYVLNPSKKSAHVAIDVTSSSGSASVYLEVAPNATTLVGLAPDSDPLALRWVRFVTGKKTPIVVARTTTILTAIPAQTLPSAPTTQNGKKHAGLIQRSLSSSAAAILMPRLSQGFAITTASTSALKSWLLAGGEVNGVTGELVFVTNPNGSSARVALSVLGASPSGTLDKTAAPKVSEILVAPHETQSVNLGVYFPNRSALAIEVDASEPVLAESALYAKGSSDSGAFNVSAGIPVG
jgi:hypothetical protein